MQVFSWCPQTEPVAQERQTVKSIGFGEGYDQSAGSGINNIALDWSLMFKGTKREILAIDAFLREHGGYTAFKWVNPLDQTALYKSKDKSITVHTPNVASMLVTFVQTFHP